MRDADWMPEDEAERERTGVIIGSGIGGLQSIAETTLILKEKGPRRMSPFFIPGGADQPLLGAGVDPLRLQGAEPCGGDGLLDRGACHRRRDAADPARRRRRDDRRRGGGGDLRDRDRRVQRLQGAVDQLQRRAGAGEPALRPRPRRVRHGRGRRRRGAGGARARPGARGEDLCRGGGLRAVGRRLSHHLAGAGRRRRLPVDERGAEGRRGSRRTRSTTSTRTAPRRRWATRSS